ncbi:RcnB family protein [Frateuria aurantia]
MKRIAFAVLLSLAGVAGVAVAQQGPPGDGHGQHDGGRGPQGGHGGGHGGPGRGPSGPAWGNNGWRGGQPHGWARGENFHQYYRGPTYAVNDYRRYHLRRPPRGYHWIRDNSGNYLMVAIATGVIADLLLH